MKNYLNDYRKEELSELAETIIENYIRDSFIQPEIIANANNITFSYGNYKDAFDGLIQHKSGRFHIFINSFRSGFKDNPKARFTFGHELGHFYIDEHRNALKSGKVASHPSFNLLLQENIAEKEADFFSSCLLMPSSRFMKSCLKTPLSGGLLEKLANLYQTSVSATIFRYFELNLYPMVIVCSKDSKVRWYFRSSDFQYKYLPAIGSEVPHSSVAGEYFYSKKEYLSEEVIFPDDWFTDFKMDKTQQLLEKCYYLKYNNTVVSIIWNKE